MVKGRNPKPNPKGWVLIHNSKSNWEVKIGLLNTTACLGHNFCYTTRIDVIQLGLEKELQDLQFICFKVFNLRSLKGSELGCKSVLKSVSF